MIVQKIIMPKVFQAPSSYLFGYTDATAFPSGFKVIWEMICEEQNVKL